LLRQVQFGVAGIGGPVGGAARSVLELGEISGGVVDVGDGEARRICRARDPAVGVVAGGGRVVVAADGGGDLGRPAEAVVGLGALIAVIGAGGGELADAHRLGVVGPAAGEIGLGPLGHAAQKVVDDSGGLRLGVGLGQQLVERVVGIGPGAEVGIRHGGLPAASVVGHGGGVARR